MVSREFITKSSEVLPEDKEKNDKLLEEIIDYVDQNDVHFADIELAYGMSLDDEDIPPHLKALVTVMKSVVERGLPMQHINKVIQSRRFYENAS